MKQVSRSRLLKRSAAGFLAALLSLAPVAGTSIFVLGFFASSTALAQPADAEVTQNDGATAGAGFASVQAAVCNAAKALQGPVGIGIGFLVLVGGIIMVQVASRDALPMIARAAFGTALLLGAGAAFGAIVTEPCAAAGGGGGDGDGAFIPALNDLVLSDLSPNLLLNL